MKKKILYSIFGKKTKCTCLWRLRTSGLPKRSKSMERSLTHKNTSSSVYYLFSKQTNKQRKIKYVCTKIQKQRNDENKKRANDWLRSDHWQQPHVERRASGDQKKWPESESESSRVDNNGFDSFQVAVSESSDESAFMAVSSAAHSLSHFPPLSHVHAPPHAADTSDKWPCWWWKRKRGEKKQTLIWLKK